jgi:hypothetical protein
MQLNIHYNVNINQWNLLQLHKLFFSCQAYNEGFYDNHHLHVDYYNNTNKFSNIDWLNNLNTMPYIL